jgi:tetratricopeptide (TPR) repeat protein
LNETIELDKSCQLYVLDYIDALIQMDRIEEALETSKILLKEFPNSIDSYLTRFKILNLLEDYNQSIWFITSVLEKYSKNEKVIECIKTAIKNELEICKYSFYYKFEQFDSIMGELDLSEYLVEKAPEGGNMGEMSLDTLIGDSLDLGDLGLDDFGLGTAPPPVEAKKETEKKSNSKIQPAPPKLTPYEYFQIGEKEFPVLRAMRNFAQHGVDFYTVGKNYLNVFYQSTYKIALKAIISFHGEEFQEYDNHLRKAFGFNDEVLKDYSKSLKKDKVN